MFFLWHLLLFFLLFTIFILVADWLWDIIHTREAGNRESAPHWFILAETSDFFIVSGSEGNYW